MIGFDDLWSILPIPAFLVAADDTIQEINPSAESFLNLSRKSLVGQPVWDKILVDASIDQSLQRARQNGVPFIVNDVDVSSGERAPVLCNLQISPMGASGDKLLLLMQPRENAHRIVHNNSSRMAARSAIGMAELLAHEIKNPLAGISGAAQLLSMNLKSDDLELTDLIVSETRRIVALLDSFDQFGDLRPPQRSAINIHDAIDRAKRSAAVGFAAHMTFQEMYDPSLPATSGDMGQLVQVFLNLLKNSAEAQPDQGYITLKSYYDPSLRVRQQDGSQESLPLQIEIIDDGPGLPTDLAEHIFDPFVSSKENGSGLGLALASKIISDHKGWISVDSVPGKTVFRISLPLAPKNES